MSKMLACFSEHSTSGLMMQSSLVQSNSLGWGNSAICSSRCVVHENFLEPGGNKKVKKQNSKSAWGKGEEMSKCLLPPTPRVKKRAGGT